MKKITISALIPNYNHAHYISIQLESMLSQRRPPDEIIIIDDASTDNSIEIIHDFMKKFDSIKLIKNKKNMGVEWNINKLIDEAKGSYIFLSAADDKTDKDFFYEVEIVAKEFPDIGVISGIVGIIDESGQCLGIRSMPLISSKKVCLNPIKVKKNLEKFGRWIQISSAVYKKECVTAVGGQDTSIGSFADNFLANLVALKYGNFFIPKVLGYWRKLESGYGHISGSDVNKLLKTAHILNDYMSINYKDEFTAPFRKKFLRHWFYMIMQNLHHLPKAQKATFVESTSFIEFLNIIKIPIYLILFLNFLPGVNLKKYIYFLLFYPKAWFIRGRYSVWKKTGKLVMVEK